MRRLLLTQKLLLTLPLSRRDNIYLFGFSRGAHQARALAGMLQQVRLLLASQRPEKLNHEPRSDSSLAGTTNSWDWRSKSTLINLASLSFLDLSTGRRCPRRSSASSPASRPLESTLSASGTSLPLILLLLFSNPELRDTVASVGAIIPRNLPFAAGATEISHFRHALALDERRGRFLPQFWLPPTRSEGIPSSHSVKEVWFVGAHANVGGGQTATDGDRTPRLSHISLRWMMREAVEQGLSLDWEALAASPIFAPFVEAGRQLSVLALLERAAEPAVSDDLAPRGDSLSFKVSKSAEGRPRAIVWSRIRNRGLTVFWWLIELSPSIKVGTESTSFGNVRLNIAFPQMEWNLEGQQREWTLRCVFSLSLRSFRAERFRRLNLGRGRRIMKDPIFHELVRMRMSALAGDFPPGDGENVVESKYVPKVRLAVGQTMADVRFVD